MNKEPTAILTALGALLASLAKVAVLLGLVQWDAVQLAGISLVIDNLILFFGALFIRAQVTPVASPSLPAGTEVNVTNAAGASTGTTTV